MLAQSSATSSARGLPRRSDCVLPRPARLIGGQRKKLTSGRSAAKKTSSREPLVLRRAARKAYWLEAHGADIDCTDNDGLSFLERSSLAEGSLELYRSTYRLFLCNCKTRRLPAKTAAQLDRAVVSMMHEMYREGELSSEAQKLISVVKKFRPSLRGAGTLPRSQTAARGFRRLAPPSTRQPLPWDCACLIASILIVDGQWLTALATLLCFCLYRRPAEIMRLTREQLVAPVRRRGHAGSYWSVTLHPRENLQSSKTGMFDESLQVDVAPFLFLGRALRVLRQRLRPGERVFPFSYGTWARRFEDAAGRGGLRVLEPILYQLRHGGVSQDASSRARTTAEIKRRGRWLDDRSLTRYENGGRVAELLGRLPIAVRRRAGAAARRVGVTLCSSCRSLSASTGQ